MENTNFQQSDIAAPQERIVEKIIYVDRPVQVELTDKKYKRWMVRGINIAVLGFFLGIAVAMVFANYNQMGWAMLSLLGAFAMLCIGTWIKKTAEYLAWWNNG